MSVFTCIVILGVLMIIGGISLMATPPLTFLSAGYFIIILFFIWGIVGIVQGIREKRYDKEFVFAILSVILGIIGLAVPGVALMNSSMLLYMAAFWLFVRGVMSIAGALERNKQGAGAVVTVIGVLLGVLELVMGCYSVAHPMVLALSLGILIGFYFIESGINVIIIGSAACQGSNNLTLLFTVIGVLMIIGAFSMMATPLSTFLSMGYCIILLFFINGAMGIVRAIIERRYGKEFAFSILSLILGIIGFSSPRIAGMNNVILLYMAAAWFFIHGVLTIIGALDGNKKGAGTIVTVLGILLGVLELVIGGYSVAHPAVLAVGLGILIGFYFLESGINMIFIGSVISMLTAVKRELQNGVDISE